MGKNKDDITYVEESVQVGTPSMVLFPPKHYYFKVMEQNYKITIPREGSYYDIDSKFFAEEDGEFDLLSKNNIMYLPAISKVLFATKQYPALKGNQLFAPIALKFNDCTVDIYGQVLELLDATDKGEEGD